MGKRFKTLLKIALIAIPVVIIVGLLVLFFGLNSMVKKGIESVGPKVTQSPVTVESVRLSPFSGKGMIKGLVVGNPEGFKTESAFKLERVKLDIDLPSLRTDKTIINEIIIDAPEITYEKSLKSSNIHQILENIKAFSGADGEEPDEPDEGDKDKPKKRLVIKRFELNGATARIGTTLTGGRTVGATLPDIHLDNLGDGEGASGVRVASEAIRELIKSLGAVTAEAGKLIGAGKEELEGMLGSGKKAAGDALDDVSEKASEAAKGVTSKVTDGVKGLLGGKKKNED